MTDKRHELREAQSIYSRRGSFDPEMAERAIRALAGHGFWSKNHITALTGAKRALVQRLVDKTERTGGRFNPDTLDLILEAITLKDRNEWNPYLIRTITEAGTSVYFLALLLDVPASTLKYRGRLYGKEGA